MGDPTELTGEVFSDLGRRGTGGGCIDVDLAECMSGTLLFRFIICRGSMAVGLSSIAESETGVAAEASTFLGVVSSWFSDLIRAPGSMVKFGKV